MAMTYQYTPDDIRAVADKIKDALAQGKTLHGICKADPDLPPYTTVVDWIVKGAREDAPEPLRQISVEYARARELQAEFWANQIIDISDDDSLDIGFDDEGKPFVRGENIQRAKLRVDARKWLASKILPRNYGDKQQVESRHVDKDGNDVTPVVTINLGGGNASASD